MVKTIGVRGPTLVRLAPVSALISIGNTPALRIVMATRGEPSTRFSHKKLVEQKRRYICLATPRPGPCTLGATGEGQAFYLYPLGRLQAQSTFTVRQFRTWPIA